jgi:hypothetical protein
MSAKQPPPPAPSTDLETLCLDVLEAFGSRREWVKAQKADLARAVEVLRKWLDARDGMGKDFDAERARLEAREQRISEDWERERNEP